MNLLFIDTETRSPVPIERGTMRYATQVELLIVTWAAGLNAPVSLWDVTRHPEPPQPLLDAMASADRIVAHEAPFDRTVLGLQPWWKPRGRWYCTSAMARRHGLPGGLDKLSVIFRLGDESKISGREWINLFCKPRKGGSWATRQTHPVEWKNFCTYAQYDVGSMREIYNKCPKWNDSEFELDLWELDYTINTRGIGVDVDFAAQAVRATTAEKKRMEDRTQELTEDVVLKPTQRDRLLAYIFVEHGVALPDLRADTIERRLDDPELPETLKELLRLRISASKASTAKYRRVIEQHVGGRLYFLLVYYGAYRTGRWAGRYFQPQNLPRAKEKKFDKILTFINAVKNGLEDILYGR